MNVADLMTTPVMSCSYDDDAQRAAQIMWDNDCGALPVLDEQGHLAGMITDRDICMAAYTRGQALWQIPVSAVMTAHVHRVHESDTLEAAERVMKDARVRRVPVLGDFFFFFFFFRCIFTRSVKVLAPRTAN